MNVAIGYFGKDYFGIFENIGSAVGEDSQNIISQCNDFMEHFIIPMSLANDIPEVKFENLKMEWKNDTAMLSSDLSIALHPAYQKIIGMGKDAVPLILKEMIVKRGQWFWALKAITGEDPVPNDEKGNIKKMTNAWIRWGENNGYIK